MVAAAEKGALKKQLEEKAKQVHSGRVPARQLDTIREKIQDLQRAGGAHPEALRHQR